MALPLNQVFHGPKVKIWPSEKTFIKSHGPVKLVLPESAKLYWTAKLQMITSLFCW